MSLKIDYHSRVGKKIGEIRERLGVSLQEISEKAKINQKTLQSIENGHRDIKISELFCIAKALNVRIGGFLNSCDFQVYQRRKEESIDGYISIKELSKALDISTNQIRRLCSHKEIPFHMLNKKYYFKGSDINAWLEHHLSSRKKIKENPFEYLKVFGIEPLISTKEVARLIGCSQSEVYDLRTKIPCYRIGRRTKFRISDIENALRKERIDLWEISTRIGAWRTPFVKAFSTKEEKIAEDESWEKKYDERARPGYVIKTKAYENNDYAELKREVQAFLDTEVNKHNALGCSYSYDEGSNYFNCEVKWWGLPEGRESYRVHSTGLSSDSPNHLHEKVMKFKEIKISPGDFIGVDYFTWGMSFLEKCHHARVTYYLPKKTDERKDDNI
jgi:excisionase family DNA binding protein